MGLDWGGDWNSWEERGLGDTSNWVAQSEGPQDCASCLDTAQRKVWKKKTAPEKGCVRWEARSECSPRDAAAGAASAAALLPASKSGHPGWRLPGPQMLWGSGEFLRNEMVHRLPGTAPRTR